MRCIAIILSALALAGCQKFVDSIDTGAKGYALRCIEGTRYVLMTSERGMALAPLLKTDGLPMGCAVQAKEGPTP